MDETTFRVLKGKRKGKTNISWMWLAIGRGPDCGPLAVFHCSPTREAAVVVELLGNDFSGILQTDFYSAYVAYVRRSRGTIVTISCLAHMRRKFVNYMAGGKMLRGDVYTAEILGVIGEIFKAHARIAEMGGLGPEEIVRLRHERIAPLYDRLEALLLEARKLVPEELQSEYPYAKAVNYALSQLPGQRNYLDAPIAAPDNNICERQIRDVALLRKNAMFSATVRGAFAVAVFTSIFAIAKLNSLPPKAYLTHLLIHAPKATTKEDFEALLPWNVKLPASPAGFPSQLAALAPLELDDLCGC